MSDVCVNHPDCGFLKKYAANEKIVDLAAVKLYCRGPRKGACERVVYRKTHNVAPPDDLMPNGALVA